MIVLPEFRAFVRAIAHGHGHGGGEGTGTTVREDLLLEYRHHNYEAFPAVLNFNLLFLPLTCSFVPVDSPLAWLPLLPILPLSAKLIEVVCLHLLIARELGERCDVGGPVLERFSVLGV